MEPISYLGQRVEAIKRELQVKTEELNRVAAEKESLEADLEAYQRALSAEKRSIGINSTPEESPATASVPDVNKAEFARRFIRDRANIGTTPTDLYSGFADAGIPISRAYMYALLQRLQKQQAIRHRRKKWFPVPAEEQEAEAAA